MNCVRCGTPLEDHVRFCRHCGLPVSASNPSLLAVPTPQEASASTDETQRIVLPHPSLEQAEAFLPPAQTALNAQQHMPRLPETPSMPPVASPVSPVPPQQNGYASYVPQPPKQPPMPSPLPYYQSANKGARRTTAAIVAPAERTRRRGCLLGCFATFLLVPFLLAAGWFFAVRPYLHSLAMTQIDQTLSNATQHIPSQVALLPVGTLPIPETALNTVIALNTSSSDPVQNTQAHITATVMRLDFQVYGSGCAISFVPRVESGQLVVTNVTITGIIALILSPGEFTALLNQHLATAQQRLGRPIQNVLLRNQEVDLVIGR